MKVIFYIDMMKRGGAQRVMSILVNHYAGKNKEVVLINDAHLEDDIGVYDIDGNVKRYYLHETFDGNPIIKNIQRMWKIRKIIKEEKPDLVLSFLGNCNIRMLLSTIGLKTRKYVSVRNDPKQEYGKNSIKKLIVNLIFSLSDGCIFQTKDASLYFGKRIRNKSQIIKNPIDSVFYNTVRHGDGTNIISIGRLEDQKNHVMLINAYAKICNAFPDDNLIIYGDGPLRSKLDRIIKEHKLENRIKLAGIINNVNEILANSKIFVMTSNYEGLPNALMEAMAVGVPCISTDCPCGGPRELILDGKNGLLVRVGEEAEVELALKTLLSNRSLRDKLSKESIIGMKEYSIDNIMSKWGEFLKI